MFLSPETIPSGWTSAGYDDGFWYPCDIHSLVSFDSRSHTLLFRYNFEYDRSPIHANAMLLLGTYHGGIVAYVNANEVYRKGVRERRVSDTKGLELCERTHSRNPQQMKVLIPYSLSSVAFSVLAIEIHRCTPSVTHSSIDASLISIRSNVPCVSELSSTHRSPLFTDGDNDAGVMLVHYPHADFIASSLPSWFSITLTHPSAVNSVVLTNSWDYEEHDPSFMRVWGVMSGGKRVRIATVNSKGYWSRRTQGKDVLVPQDLFLSNELDSDSVTEDSSHSYQQISSSPPSSMQSPHSPTFFHIMFEIYDNMYSYDALSSLNSVSIQYNIPKYCNTSQGFPVSLVGSRVVMSCESMVGYQGYQSRTCLTSLSLHELSHESRVNDRNYVHDNVDDDDDAYDMNGEWSEVDDHCVLVKPTTFHALVKFSVYADGLGTDLLITHAIKDIEDFYVKYIQSKVSTMFETIREVKTYEIKDMSEMHNSRYRLDLQIHCLAGSVASIVKAIPVATTTLAESLVEKDKELYSLSLSFSSSKPWVVYSKKTMWEIILSIVIPVVAVTGIAILLRHYRKQVVGWYQRKVRVYRAERRMSALITGEIPPDLVFEPIIPKVSEVNRDITSESSTQSHSSGFSTKYGNMFVIHSLESSNAAHKVNSLSTPFNVEKMICVQEEEGNE